MEMSFEYTETFTKGEFKLLVYIIKNMSTKTKFNCMLGLLAIILLLDFLLLALAELVGWAILIGVCSGITFLIFKFKKIFMKDK